GTLRVDLRRPDFDHTWTNFAKTDSSEVAERLAAATIAIVNKVPVREDALSKLPRLKLIAVAATGTDIVDLAACRLRGVVVQNIRNYANASLPEHVFALILALRRNRVAYRADVEAGLCRIPTIFACWDIRFTSWPGRLLASLDLAHWGKQLPRWVSHSGCELSPLTCVH